MHFNTCKEGGIISGCGRYRIIKGHDGKWEIYKSEFGQWYMMAERKLLTKAIGYCQQTEKLEKILKDY